MTYEIELFCNNCQKKDLNEYLGEIDVAKKVRKAEEIIDDIIGLSECYGKWNQETYKEKAHFLKAELLNLINNK